MKGMKALIKCDYVFSGRCLITPKVFLRNKLRIKTQNFVNILNWFDKRKNIYPAVCGTIDNGYVSGDAYCPLARIPIRRGRPPTGAETTGAEADELLYFPPHQDHSRRTFTVILIQTIITIYFF